MEPGRFSFLSAGGAGRSSSSLAGSHAPPPRKEYPVTAEGYELVEECGRGVSATVRAASRAHDLRPPRRRRPPPPLARRLDARAL